MWSFRRRLFEKKRLSKRELDNNREETHDTREHLIACIVSPLLICIPLCLPIWNALAAIPSLVWLPSGDTGELVASISYRTALFILLFAFRYLRLVVHVYSFWFLYQPAQIPANPSFGPRDCSIIIPTVDSGKPGLRETLESCLPNFPGEIFIVTAGESMLQVCEEFLPQVRGRFPSIPIKVISCSIANKRWQIAAAIPFVSKSIIVLLDDHVFLPSCNFLPAALAPFEDPSVGAVGTNKRVRRTEFGINARAFWNMLGALYLERHNFEIRATNAIDGGVFVVSGRASLWRTTILQELSCFNAYLNEKFFFDYFGPLHADDDNFLTRWVVARGWNIKIQYCKDSLIETSLGEYPKFLSQCLRWARTTWRSNSASLFTDRTVWRRQPWCVYAVYMTSFVNFALFYDAALIYALIKSPLSGIVSIWHLLTWILLTKLVKLTPYFLRHPDDLIMLPGHLLFAYFHSLIKLYAGLTFFVTAWGGRDLDKINSEPSVRPATRDSISDPSTLPGKTAFKDPWIPNVEDEDYYEREFGVPEAGKQRKSWSSSPPLSERSSRPSSSSSSSCLFPSPASCFKRTSRFASSSSPFNNIQREESRSLSSSPPPPPARPSPFLSTRAQPRTNPFARAHLSSGSHNPFRATGRPSTQSSLRLRLSSGARLTPTNSQLRPPLAASPSSTFTQATSRSRPDPNPDPGSDSSSEQISPRRQQQHHRHHQRREPVPLRARDQHGRMWVRGPNCDTVHLDYSHCPFADTQQACSVREIWDL